MKTRKLAEEQSLWELLGLRWLWDLVVWKGACWGAVPGGGCELCACWKSCGHVFGVNSNLLAAFLFPAHGMVWDAFTILFRNCFTALFLEEEPEIQICVHLIFVVFGDALQ